MKVRDLHPTCPGPGFERKCESLLKCGKLGGRCNDCRLENMRLRSRFEHKTLNGKGSRPRHWGQKAEQDQKRVQEEIDLARKVANIGMGIKGAIQVHEAMMRAA